MNIDSRPVRLVCTGQGQHPRPWVVGTYRLTATSVEHVRSIRSTAPHNRPGHETLRRQWRERDGLGTLPDFDLRCRWCRQNPRLAEAGMRELVAGLLAMYPDTPVVEVDISAPHDDLPSGGTYR